MSNYWPIESHNTFMLFNFRYYTEKAKEEQIQLRKIAEKNLKTKKFTKSL
jgi:hypothetical protein